MLPRLLFLGYALVGFCVAGPVFQDRTPACDSPSPLAIGRTYTYKYEGENKIENADVTHNLQVRANVELAVYSSCRVSLQLKDVILQGVSVGDRYAFKNALEKHPVLFTYDRGIIRGIWYHPEEEPCAVNIKRGVLSLLQLPQAVLESVVVLTEEDVLGVCETEYLPQTLPANRKSIIKRKNLATCSGKLGTTLPIFYTPYESRTSAFQTPPLVNGTYECRLVTNANNVLQKTICAQEEEFEMVARKTGDRMKSTAQGSLELTREDSGTVTQPDEAAFIRTSLQLDHSNVWNFRSNENEVMSILRSLCATTNPDVRPETGELFTSLVRSLRGLQHSQLDRVYISLTSQELCSSQKLLDVFLDALPLVGNAAAVKQMVELLNQRSTGDRQDVYIRSFAYLSYPTEETVRALLPLLKKSDPETSAILSVTSTVHTFCKQQKTVNCEDIEAVQEVIAALTKHLGYKCRTNDLHERTKIIVALKGFGNVGHIGEALNSILECISPASNNPLAVRLAAIEALRRTCIPEAHSKLLELLQNIWEDVEVRIAAYLGLMKCPDFTTINHIVDLLEREQVNQVGAFIYSHLKNLQASASPLKQELRTRVHSLFLKEKFSRDFRKFSQNFEWSHFSEPMNMGATVDGNLIFSPKSFVPRSAALNLTVDLFSHSINLLEVGGRVEGFDFLLENLFSPSSNYRGPEGFLSRLHHKLGSPLSNRRNRRSADRDNKVSLLDERVNAVTPNDPQGSAYLKIFGNELSFVEFHSLEDLTRLLTNYGKRSSIFDGMERGKQLDIVRNLLFLDFTITSATLTGVPLRGDVNATATVGLKMDAKYDPQRLSDDFILEGSIEPSAVVEVGSLLTLDAGVIKRGVRSRTMIHSSTIYDGKLELKQNGDVHFKFNTPRNKQELLSVKSTIFSVDAGNEIPLEAEKSRTFDRCTTSLVRPLGMNFCLKGNVPEPFVGKRSALLPFYRPYDLQLIIEKSDRGMQGWELRIQRPKPGDARTKFYQFLLDTPGSTYNRKILAELEFRKPDDTESNVRFTFQCPCKKVEFTGVLLNVANMIRLNTELIIDDSRKITAVEQVEMSRQGRTTTLKPRVEVTVLDMEPFIMDGSIEIVDRNRQQINVDLKANKPAEKPIFIKGSIIREPPRGDSDRGSIDMTVRVPKLEIRCVGFTSRQNKLITEDITIEYEREGYRKHTVRYNIKMKNLSNDQKVHVSGTSELLMSQYPEYNLQVDADIHYILQGQKTYDLKLRWGENFLSEVNKLHVFYLHKSEGERGHGSLATSENRVLIRAPFWDLDLDGTFHSTIDLISLPKLNFTSLIKYGDDKKIQVDLRYVCLSRKPVHMTIDARFLSPNTRIVYKDEVQERSPNEYQGQTTLEWGDEGKKLTLDYTLTSKSDANSVHHEIDTRLLYPGARVPIRHRELVRLTREAVDIKTDTEVDGTSFFNFDLTFNRKKQQSEFTFNSRCFKTKISATSKGHSRVVSFELREYCAFEPSPSIVSSMSVITDPQKQYSFTTLVYWDYDHDQTKRIKLDLSATALGEANNTHYEIIGNLECCNHIALKINSNLPRFYKGSPATILIETRRENITRSLFFKLDPSDEAGYGLLLYKKLDEERIRIDYSRNVTSQHRTYDIKITSVYPKLHGRHLTIAETLGSSFDLNLRYERNPERVYTLVIHDTSSRTQVDNHIKITTPYEKYSDIQITTKGQCSDAIGEFKVQYLSTTKKTSTLTLKFDLKNPLKKTLLALELESPYERIKDVKLHLKINNINGNSDYRFFLYHNDHYHFDIREKHKYDSSQEFEHEMTFSDYYRHTITISVVSKTNDQQIFYSLNVNKDGGDVFSSEIFYKSTPERRHAYATIGSLYTQTARLDYDVLIHSQENKTFTIKYSSGPGHYLLITGSTLIIDGFKHRTGYICQKREAPAEDSCFTMKLVYKLNSTGPYDSEVKLSIEKDEEFDIVLDYAMQENEGTCLSKCVLTSSGQRIGYLYTYEHDESTSTRTLQMYLFTKALELKRHRIKSEGKYELITEATLDPEDTPERKMTFNYLDIQEGNAVNIVTRVTHPDLGHPIVLKVSLEKNVSEELLTKFVAELQPACEDNAIFLEFYHQHDVITPNNHSYEILLYHKDRNIFDSSLTLYWSRLQDVKFGLSDHPDIFSGIVYTYRTEQQMYRGLITSRIDANNNLKFEYLSPYEEYTIFGHLTKVSDKNYTAELTHVQDSKEHKVHLTMSCHPLNIVLISYDENNAPDFKIRIDATRPPKLKFETEVISFLDDNSQKVDFSFSVEKRGSKIFRTRLYLPPESAQNALNSARSGVNDLLDQRVYSDIKQELEHRYNQSATFIDEHIVVPLTDRFLEVFGEVLGEIVLSVNEIVFETPLGEKLMGLQETLSELYGKLEAYYQKLAKRSRSKRDVNQAMEEYTEYIVVRILDLLNSPVVVKTLNFIEEVYIKIADRLGEYRYRLGRKMEELWQTFLNNEDVKAIIDGYTGLNDENPLNNPRKTGVLGPLRAALVSGLQVKSRSGLVNYDSQVNKLIYDIELPMDSLEYRRLFSQLSKLSGGDTNDVSNLAPKDYVFLNPEFLDQEWIPPFSGQALILGGKHFITFDKTFYSTSGDCSYLLARDFVDGNFTVLIKYNTLARSSDGPQKSIIVQIGKDFIEIFPNKHSVTLNDQPTELPVVLANNAIVSRSESLIEVNDPKNVRVLCHLHYDVCLTVVKGWHFGKTAGLLGTFDNEAFNDMMKPRGQVISDAKQFVKKWEMAKNCKGRVEVLTDAVPSDSEEYRLCQTYFQDQSSPLANGFWHEPPEPYFNLCLRYMASLPKSTTSMQAVCNLTFAYNLQLGVKGISSSLPRECYTCSLGNEQTVEFGNSEYLRQSSDIPRASDVVFLVEESACNRDVAGELESITKLTDRELARAGFTGRRYSVVGFGHNDAKPYIRTAKDKVFFSSQDIHLALQSLRTDSSRGQNDILDAIRFAADLPYHPGASKTIVVLACSTCNEDISELSYPDVQTMLLDNGIILHFLTPQSIQVRGSTTKGKFFYGVDADSVYSGKDISQTDLVGHPDVRKQVAVPKDICVALAQEVHGSYFSTEALRGSDAKNWKSLFSRRLVKSAQPPECQRCDCLRSNDYTPKVICKPCSTPAPKVPIKLYATLDEL